MRAPDAPWLGSGRDPWLDEVRAWLFDRLRAEPAGVVKERPWSLVLRARGPDGVLYFKAAARPGRHEAALLSALAPRWPDLVPAPLAADPERGWLVLAEFGRTLREAFAGRDPLPVWEALLPRYAELQIASAGETRAWLAYGLPDRRLERLPQLLEALAGDDEALDPARPGALSSAERCALAALAPRVEAQCRALARSPHPAALEHGDLHDANVLVRGPERRLFDWGDSNLCHPFTSLLLVHEHVGADEPGRRERLRDAYLEPWTALAPRRELVEHYERALWLSNLGRALDFQWMLAGSGAAAAEWRPHIDHWLRRLLAVGEPPGAPATMADADA